MESEIGGAKSAISGGERSEMVPEAMPEPSQPPPIAATTEPDENSSTSDGASSDGSSDDSAPDGARVGEAYQAVLPEMAPPGAGSSSECSAVLISRPIEPEQAASFAAFIEQARGEGALPAGAEPLRGADEAMAAEAWLAHAPAGGGVPAALSALRDASRRAASTEWDEGERAALGKALREVGNDLRRVHASLRRDGVERPFDQLVSAYYRHFYAQLGFNAADDHGPPTMRPKKPQKKLNGEGGVLHPRLVAVPEGAVLPKSLAEMLGHGLIEPGRKVLSVKGLDGTVLTADLLQSGMIRHAPPDGGGSQLYRTPALFARAVTVRFLPARPRPARLGTRATRAARAPTA